MAAPATPIWDLDPHSHGKHEILRRYMQAWMAILGQSVPELVYIDGFAGPGRYSRGEDGSPIIALKVALEHRAQIRSTIRFLFVEQHNERANALAQILDGIERPANFLVRVAGGTTFEQAVGSFLDEYGAKGQLPPPMFIFIDPFGWSRVPFQLVRRILSFRSCEALITFMYEEINRFIGHPDQEHNFDAFFGTDEWRHCIALGAPKERKRYLHDLYLRQLRVAAGVQYVRSFEMRNEKDVTDYFLFYATHNLLGLKRMKESMWVVDPSGAFRFSDATDPRQLVLFGGEPQYEILRSQVTDRFRGQETTVGDIEKFVVAETAFRETHYKRQVLRVLELSQPTRLVLIDPPSHRKAGTYPDLSQRVRFI
ncbi:MAG: three-Cys-motif partner protein TcmP [Dehalococcoidia bacterium]|nr:three-Cys-motif partner protein TcmP [Dehalococcoidia bacterium]